MPGALEDYQRIAFDNVSYGEAPRNAHAGKNLLVDFGVRGLFRLNTPLHPRSN